MKRRITLMALTVTLFAAALGAHAAEIGHYNGGILNIRDYFVPEPGIYGALYNYFYHTGRLNDRHGDEINTVTINPRGGPGVALGVDVNVDLYALAPALIWVTDLKPLGVNSRPPLPMPAWKEHCRRPAGAVAPPTRRALTWATCMCNRSGSA